MNAFLPSQCESSQQGKSTHQPVPTPPGEGSNNDQSRLPEGTHLIPDFRFFKYFAIKIEINNAFESEFLGRCFCEAVLDEHQ